MLDGWPALEIRHAQFPVQSRLEKPHMRKNLDALGEIPLKCPISPS